MIDREAFQKAKIDPAFRESGWLTFYLEGTPERHATMAPGLRKLGAVNLTDGVGGFVYAKVPVVIAEVEIVEQISNVSSLSEKAGIEIGVIDLDANSDVEKSKFYTLWQSSLPQKE
jgi:hypothetical protein